IGLLNFEFFIRLIELMAIKRIFIVVFCCFNVKFDHLVHFLSFQSPFFELKEAQAFSIVT
ncbi:hypothetical protein D7B96_20100, partial [Salmonella enterica]|nr:hypothetical protein [Salmonella enterica]